LGVEVVISTRDYGVPPSLLQASDRRVFLVATIVFLLFGLLPVNAASGSGSSCEGVTRRGSGWTTISVPPATISYAIDPVAPNRIYAVTRESVFGSRNGGCSWKEIFTLLDQLPDRAIPCPPGVSYVRSIDVGTSRSTHNHLFLQVASQAQTIFFGSADTWTCVLKSENAGKTWTVLGEGTAADTWTTALGAGELIIAPGRPKTIFLTRDSRLHVSHNEGKTWVSRLLPGTYSGENAERYSSWTSGCSSFSVNPANPKELWLWSSGLKHSVDEGRTWTPVDSAPPFTNPIDVTAFLSNSKHSGLLATQGGYDSATGKSFGTVFVSTDGGREWSSYHFPANSWGMGCVSANQSGNHALAIGAQDMAVLYRLPSGVGFSVKDYAFTEEFAGDFQMAPTYASGSFYFLIRPLTANELMIARYSEEGI
jgi:hypothetical protein